MQVIEGNKSSVEQLFKNIQSDNRHTGIIVISKKAIAEREFSDWTISYRNLTGSNIEGFSNFLSLGNFPEGSTKKIGYGKRFLLSFRSNN